MVSIKINHETKHREVAAFGSLPADGAASMLRAMVDEKAVLVTGANGFVGSHLADHLVAEGRRVRALVRRTSDLRYLPYGVEIVFGDVTDVHSLPHALAGVSTVYHVAGLVATHRPADYFDVNEKGTRNLLGACLKAAPDLKRFVLVSSLAAAGPSPDGTPIRETEPPRPVSAYGRSKLAGERVVLECADHLPIAIARPPVVYGPRDSDVFTFFEMIAKRIAPAFPRQKFYSVCHVRDLVRGIALVGESPAAVGRTWNLADPKAVSMDGLFRAIARALDSTPVRIPVPEPLLRLLAGPADTILPALGVKARPLADKVREMLPDYWIADTTAARRDLGFTTRVPLGAGIDETAAFYRSEGWL